MQVRSILESKAHNKHFLDRYVKFISSCTHRPGEYVELHHICPKSKDLFPEYADLTSFPWNGKYLTARQHILAHILLWKAYESNSQLTAVHYFLNVQNSSLCSISRRKIPNSVSIRYAAKAREAYYNSRKGFAAYKDEFGNSFFLHRDDPLISELGLVGSLTGFKMEDHSRAKMSAAKLRRRTIILNFMLYSKKVNVNDTLYPILLDLGWVPYTTPEMRAARKQNQKDAVRAAIKGKGWFFNSDGSYFGLLEKDDPQIKELDLSYVRSEKQIAQQTKRAELAKEALTDSIRYNNGTEEISSKVHPGEGWIVGRLPRSAEYAKNHAEATSARIKGSVTYTDGAKNYRLKEGQTPEPSWKRGMAPQKVREFTYSNGAEMIKLTAKQPIPEGFTRTTLK